MVTIIAKLKAVAGKEKELAELCKKMAIKVREIESGCLDYVPFLSLEDPTVIVFLEKYVDEEAFVFHVETPYFKEFVGNITPLMAAELDVQKFNE